MPGAERRTEEATPKTTSAMFGGVLIGCWWLTIFAVVFIIDIDDDALFAVIVMVLPALLLVAFLVAVTLWIMFRLLVALSRHRWRTAVSSVAIAAAALVFGNAGQLAGDQWLIRVEGVGLEQAVAAVRAGRSPPARVMATATAAYVETNPFFETVQGIAYDMTGRLAEMLALPLEERPKEWLDRVPQAFSCWGAARPLGGNYYRTNLDRYRCSRE